MNGVQLRQYYSHFEEAVYFLPISSPKLLVVLLSTLEGCKPELTLKPTSGFEHGTLNRESSALTTTPLLHKVSVGKKYWFSENKVYVLNEWHRRFFLWFLVSLIFPNPNDLPLSSIAC